MTIETSLFDRSVELPDELREKVAAKGWPENLAPRALALRVPQAWIADWLTYDTPVREIERELAMRQWLQTSTVKLREATWQDNEAMADLFAASPEQIGDWQVTVERGPYAFAQFRLQEHPQIQVVEDQGVLLAAMARSVRNTLVGGRRLSVQVTLAARVREEARGKGYSNLVRRTGPACQPFAAANYWYIRSGNVNAVDWLNATSPNLLAGAPAREGEVPGLPVSVHCYPARPLDSDPRDIRPTRRSDARRCAALINRTHQGMDLFRPYTPEFLQSRLDDRTWGPKPAWWTRVYGWEDHYVLEEDGRVVACAGLWDRGRDLREVWRNPATGEERRVESTALLDFGYAEGREGAMARLIEYLLGVTATLGRGRLIAPVEHLPALAALLERHAPVLETRALEWTPPRDEQDRPIDLPLTRPYTDLVYW
jgi:hypothetical protein